MSSEPRTPEVLAMQFARLRRRLVGVSVAGGIGLTVLVTVLAVAAALTLDMLVDLPVMLRLTMLVSVGLIFVAVAGWTILRPLSQQLENRELAAFVEEAYPDLDERLLSSVELLDTASSEKGRSSPLMRRWLLSQTVEFARGHDFAESVDGRKAVQRCWLGGGALVALIIPLLFAGSAYGVMWSRFLNPWSNLERIQNLILTVVDGDRTEARGADVELRALVSWRFRLSTIPPTAWIDATTERGFRQKRRMDWNEEQQAYSGILPDVQESFDYVISTAGSRTRRHHIEVGDRPDITRFSIEVEPPSYTGQPAQRHDPVLGEVLAIEQSRLRVDAEFAAPVTSAELLWLDSTPAEMGRSTEEAATRRTPLTLKDDGRSAMLDRVWGLDDPSGRFVVAARDERGLQLPKEPVRRLTIQPDTAPQLQFGDREELSEARPDDVISIPLIAGDDFGIAGCELHIDVQRGPQVHEQQQINIPADQLPARRLDHMFELDLAALKLTSGQQLSLRVRAIDQRPVPGPNETWSDPRVLSIRQDAAPYGQKTLADRQNQVEETLAQLAADLHKQQEQAERLQADAKTDIARERSWQHEEETRALQSAMERTKQQLAQAAAVLENQPLFEQIAEQAGQVGKDLLPAAQSEIEQARQAELADKPASFAKAAEKLQQAGERLADLQKDYQQLAEMQRDLLELNRLASGTERLAREVDDLVGRRIPADELAGREQEQRRWDRDHRQLSSQHQGLERGLEQLAARHPELREAALETLAQQRSELARQAGELAERQQTLSDSIKDQDPASPPTENTPLEAQKELQQELGTLQQELAEHADELRAPVLTAGSPDGVENQKQEQESVKRALESAAQAASNIQQATEALQQNDREQSSTRGQEGAAQLREVEKSLSQDSMANASERTESAPVPPQEAPPPAPQPEPPAADTPANDETPPRPAGKNETESSPGTDQPSSRPEPEPNRPASPETNASPPLAKETIERTGRQIVRASCQLCEAGRQLAKLGTPAAGQESEDFGQGLSSQEGEGSEPGASGRESGEGAESGDGQSKEGALTQSLRLAAQSLRSAAQQMGVAPGSASLGESQSSADMNSEFGNESPARPGAAGGELSRFSNRDWGKLPPTLEQDLLESSRRQPTGEYARPIRRYFEEVSRTRAPSLEETP